MQAELFATERWRRVSAADPRAAALADRHYSRQTPGARDFLPPGRRLALLTDDGRALWGVCENLFRGVRRWRVTIFRNEGAGLSSDLIREATAATRRFWSLHYGGCNLELTTEISVTAVRHKRDPGRCFLRAGWILRSRAAHGRHKAGSVLLVAPSLAQNPHASPGG